MKRIKRSRTGPLKVISMADLTRISIIKQGVARGETIEQMAAKLKKEGVPATPRSVRSTIGVMTRAGLLLPLPTLSVVKETLIRLDVPDSMLNNVLEEKGFAAASPELVSKAKRQLGITPSRQGKKKRKPYPKLSTAQLALLERAVKPLERLSKLIASDHKLYGADAEDFYGHCLEQLPRWIPGIDSKKDLKRQLRQRIYYALKNFRLERTMQTTGLTRAEVETGIELKGLLQKGKSIEEAAARMKMSVGNAKELVEVLSYRQTRYIDGILKR